METGPVTAFAKSSEASSIEVVTFEARFFPCNFLIEKDDEKCVISSSFLFSLGNMQKIDQSC